MGVEVRFEWVPERDIYIVYPIGFVRSEDDCKEWAKAFEEKFAGFPRRVDMVILLEMFSVDPAISPIWIRYRRLTLTHARFCIRVASESDVFPTSPTRAVPSADLTKDAPTIPDAMDVIERLRRSM